MRFPFTIQIPVFNETRALEFSNFYLHRMGWRPRYVLDSQCTPAARATLERIGHEAVFFQNDKPFIENGYENFAAVSLTDWILRLDCDEVPSPELIEFCRGFVDRDEHGIAGFERHQVIWREHQFLAATAARFWPSKQRQWRLFNRSRVRFTRQIHSAGIEKENPVAAPPDAVLYHLSWVFLTWEDRLEKAARYDRHGQAPYNRANQLFPLEDAHWEPLDAPPLSNAYTEWLQGDTPVKRPASPASVRGCCPPGP